MTDYISNINNNTIGGKNFDNSTWTYPQVNNTSAIVTNLSLTGSNQTRTYNISGFFPNDDCDYECTFEGNITTGSTSGNSASYWIYPTSSANGTFYRMGRTITRTSSTVVSGGQVTVIIKGNTRKVTLSSGDSTTGTATYSLYLKGIKRLGKNSVGDADYIENIKIPSGTIPVGGKQIGGRPVISGFTRDFVGAGTLAVNEIKQYSLANILPNDGCNYEVKVSSRARTGTASGNNINIKIGNNTSSASAPPVCYRTQTRTSNYEHAGGNAIVFINSDRRITIANNGNATASNVGLYLESYRRLGTNSGTGFLEQIKTPNGTFPFGGNITTGNFVYKTFDVYDGKTFSATGETKYTINNYLPNTGQDYEVFFNAYGRTGSANASTILIWVMTQPNTWTNAAITTYVNTRYSGNVPDERTGSFYIKNSTGSFNLYAHVSDVVNTSGNCGLTLIGYRRLGTNE